MGDVEWLGQRDLQPAARITILERPLHTIAGRELRSEDWGEVGAEHEAVISG
jgi:hypothetical protein